MTETVTPRNGRRATRVETETREPVRAKTRTRKGGGQDQLAFPQELRDWLTDNDIDMQWNTIEVFGRPEMQMMAQMAAQAWEPVTVGMFDNKFDYLMPRGSKGEITFGGLRLEWRPLELSREAKLEDDQAARAAVRAEENKLRGGNLDGVTLDTQHPTARAKTFISKERIPSMPIPR